MRVAQQELALKRAQYQSELHQQAIQALDNISQQRLDLRNETSAALNSIHQERIALQQQEVAALNNLSHKTNVPNSSSPSSQSQASNLSTDSTNAPSLRQYIQNTIAEHLPLLHQFLLLKLLVPPLTFIIIRQILRHLLIFLLLLIILTLLSFLIRSLFFSLLPTDDDVYLLSVPHSTLKCSHDDVLPASPPAHSTHSMKAELVPVSRSTSTLTHFPKPKSLHQDMNQSTLPITTTALTILKK